MKMTNRLANVKLKNLLAASFMMLLVVVLALGVVSVKNASTIAENTATLYDRPHTNLVGMWEAKAEIAQIGNSMREGILQGTPLTSEQAAQIATIDTKLRTIESNKVDKNAPMSDNMKTILEAINLWSQKATDIQQILSSGGTVSAEMVAEFSALEADAIGKVDLIIATAAGNALKFRNNAMDSARGMMYMMSVIFLIVAAMILIISVVAHAKITRPMAVLLQAAKDMENGLLDTEIDYRSKDEFGELAQCFRQMQVYLQSVVDDITGNLDKISAGDFRVITDADYVGDFETIKQSFHDISSYLSKTLQQINRSADEVSMGSSQVSGGAQALSQGATEQAGAIEELAATINDISVKVEKNADSAVLASKQAAEVSAEMDNGRQQMQQMQLAMNEITDTSTRINNVIKTIEDIAFQTNILALNAAVEAARAGSAGKGFAVVADEVRNLATKSADAAHNTAELIENTIKAIQGGKQLADQAVESYDKIVDSAEKSTELLKEITEASHMQAEAIAQVTLGIDQISSVVQMNSATSEESAAASTELSNQAQILKELVDSFKIQEGLA